MKSTGEILKRNATIELYRCMMMFGVIMIHLFLQLFNNGGDKFLFGLSFCVNGFALISGYFGVRFSARKLLMLYLTALWSLLIVCLLHGLMTGLSPVTKLFWEGYIAVFKDYWFLHAYALMMCFVPVIDSAVENKRWRIFVPVLFAVFVVGLLNKLVFFHHFIPEIAGLCDKSGITLVAIYIVGRFYRLHEDWFNSKSLWVFVFCWVVFTLVGTSGYCWFGAYNSPTTLGIAVCTFSLSQRIRLSGMISKIILTISPSMFAVYVLHAHIYFYSFAHDLLLSLGSWKLLAVPPIALITFLICILIDAPRRLLVRLWNS